MTPNRVAAMTSLAAVAIFFSPLHVALLIAWAESKREWDSNDHPNDMFGVGDPSIWYGLFVFTTAAAAIVLGVLAGHVAGRVAARHRGLDLPYVGWWGIVGAFLLAGVVGAVGVLAIGVLAEVLRGPIVPVAGVPLSAAGISLGLERLIHPTRPEQSD